MAQKNQIESEAVKRDMSFVSRHIGPQAAEIDSMLSSLGCESLDQLIDQTVPKQILDRSLMDLSPAAGEQEIIERLRKIAAKNRPGKSYLGQGYYPSITPPVIQRNILENPGWYTQYTPYQAEIAQGRLEALLNFQTIVTDLTGMELANSSLLDEGTAAAEAMVMCYRAQKEDRTKFVVSNRLHPQTIAVIKTRAEPLEIELDICETPEDSLDANTFAAIIQYPDSYGRVEDFSSLSAKCKDSASRLIVASDLLALTLLEAPGNLGADVVVGSAQRFGVGLGYGGPHAGFFATKEEFKRFIPGRIVGVSKDRNGKPALRLALQVREQHIKRDRATSNICTAQVLLAVVASMYGVYHGPDGLTKIASTVHQKTRQLKEALKKSGIEVSEGLFFDTLSFKVSKSELPAIRSRAEDREIHLRYLSDSEICVALDETVLAADLENLLQVIVPEAEFNFSAELGEQTLFDAEGSKLKRTSSFMQAEAFKRYQTETELLRYMNRLQSKDLSLTASMIPLGSCTMKLNATTEMLAVTWPEFAGMHPFIPEKFAAGYKEMIDELERDLAEITGFAAVSLQPNAGSQGEYAGLLAIQGWHASRGDTKRNICLIPESAHGTNPASAIMAGMKVLPVKCDEQGDINLEDLKAGIEKAGDALAALMVTYPSTHGVFEEAIKDICSMVHDAGGQVYMDGANMNAQVGLCKPGDLGADVCHLNLHKTFCIPHGGGGPGVGPIGVAAHLSDFLPGDPLATEQGNVGPVSSAKFGSAGVLPISWSYIKLMGAMGLRKATEVAILNANYIAKRLEPHYPVLYKGKNGFVAHECILDLRAFKKNCGVTVEDVAKRLMDYGFHAPTVSWPVIETLMVEPTESESQAELDRFCDAMIAIRKEIAEVESGEADKQDNLLKNAPHTALEIGGDEWRHKYARSRAAWPVEGLKDFKFWPAVARIDSAYGDRNLVCSCGGVGDYSEV